VSWVRRGPAAKIRELHQVFGELLFGGCGEGALDCGGEQIAYAACSPLRARRRRARNLLRTRRRWGRGRAAPSGHGGDGARTSHPIPRVTTVIPFLRCVFSTVTGVDFIESGDCVHRGVAVATSSTTYSTGVADHAVGMLIDVLRRWISSSSVAGSGLCKVSRRRRNWI
jgi:hypothetical protein